MPRVLGAVEREHARSDDLRRREARVVDRERVGVAHHLDDEVGRVTSQPSSTGSQETGSLSRSLSWSACGLGPSSSAIVADAPTGNDAIRPSTPRVSPAA